MDEMLALLDGHTPCFLFEQLFLERLPEDLRAHLVGTKWDDPCQLVRQADALWSCREALPVNAVHRTSRPQAPWSQEKIRPLPLTHLPLQTATSHVTSPAGLEKRLISAGNRATEQKREDQPLVAATAGQNNGLLFVTDSVSKQQFLVDTGGWGQCFSCHWTGHEVKTAWTTLLAANGSSIQTYGTRSLPGC